MIVKPLIFNFVILENVFNFVILEKFLVLYSIPKIGLGTFCHIHLLEEV
jgi:hypothetical protein